jgi:hypothetical protein
MKPETVRIPVMTSPCSACVPSFVGAVAGNWDGCHRVLRRMSHGAGLDDCHHHYNARVRGCGLTHLSGYGCARACGDVPLWRHQTRTFAAAHPGL